MGPVHPIHSAINPPIHYLTINPVIHHILYCMVTLLQYTFRINAIEDVDTGNLTFENFLQAVVSMLGYVIILKINGLFVLSNMVNSYKGV